MVKATSGDFSMVSCAKKSFFRVLLNFLSQNLGQLVYDNGLYCYKKLT